MSGTCTASHLDSFYHLKFLQLPGAVNCLSVCETDVLYA